MQHERKIGNTDRPIENFEKDEFQIEAYIAGLAEFIEECETPMTIAVQGDWGCGKTSMMNMVRQYVKQKDGIIDVWFNTWQFSQFNMDDRLVITFLQHLIKELSMHLPEDSEEKKEINGKLKPIMKTIAVGMTRHFAGSDIGDMLEGVIGEAEKKKEEISDLADEMFELKKNFQKLIQEVANSTEKRVVVFIDDLDRLQPVRAVELLEVLKLFLDCDNCVFVMAIDTSVVFQGIREKYGRDMTNEKAQSFFDKMIQLPFKMPTAYYRLDKMLERLLDFLQDDTMTDGERKKYISVIREVTDGNPRTIKRLANAVLLEDKVAARRNLYTEEEDKVQSMIRRLLVVLACVQLRYEPVYGFLVNNITYGHMKRILDIKMPGGGEANRGELLIKALRNIGMTDTVVAGELVFYNLIHLFVDLSRDFVHWFKEKGNEDVTAINKLIQVVSLNNIRDISMEDKAVSVSNEAEMNASAESIIMGEANPQEGMHPSTDMMAMMYAGMIHSGRAMEVYHQLTEKRVYPRLGYHMNYAENPELMEFRKKPVKPKESYLFCKLDEVLRQHYTVKEYHKPEEERDFKYYYSIDVGSYETFTITLDYSAPERCIAVSSSLKFKAGMEAFEWCKEFIEKVRKEYKRLQTEYSGNIFPDKDMQFTEERDEDGELQGITPNCYVLSETMADLLIEFLVKIALHKNSLIREGDNHISLLDIADGMA